MTEIPGGGGSNAKPPGMEIQRGGGSNWKKTLRGGGMDIFWNHTIHILFYLNISKSSD